MDERFQNLPISEIPSFLNLKNSENLLIFQIVKFWKFVNFLIWEIQKIADLKNSKNFQFRKFQNSTID